MSIESTKYLRELRHNMVMCLDLDELETLALDLSIDWEELPGEDGKTSKCRSFIMYLARRGRLSELVAFYYVKKGKMLNGLMYLPPSNK